MNVTGRTGAFTVLPVPDVDGDGTPDASDCAPADPTLETPATEVLNVQVADRAGSPTVHDVVTGDPQTLRLEGGCALAICGSNDLPRSPFVDSTPIGPAEIRFWRVKACNACNVGVRTFGNSGLSPDPRDALAGHWGQRGLVSWIRQTGPVG